MPDQSPESARLAMGYTFFIGESHNGLFLQWLGLSSHTFNSVKRDGLISTAMEPVFGEAYKRPFRNIIDILAIIATVMGIATSIGLGIMQISGG